MGQTIKKLCFFVSKNVMPFDLYIMSSVTRLQWSLEYNAFVFEVPGKILRKFDLNDWHWHRYWYFFYNLVFVVRVEILSHYAHTLKVCGSITLVLTRFAVGVTDFLDENNRGKSRTSHTFNHMWRNHFCLSMCQVIETLDLDLNHLFFLLMIIFFFISE